MATRTGFDPSTYSSATATFVLGSIVEYNGNRYAYLLNSDNATANGDVMHWTATATTQNGGTGLTVNNRLVATGGTPASSSNNVIAAIAVGVVASGQYGFFLVRGYHSAIKCEAGVAAGDLLKPSAATDLRATVVSAATHIGLVQATAAVAANLVPGMVYCG